MICIHGILTSFCPICMPRTSEALRPEQTAVAAWLPIASDIPHNPVTPHTATAVGPSSLTDSHQSRASNNDVASLSQMSDMKPVTKVKDMDRTQEVYQAPRPICETNFSDTIIRTQASKNNLRFDEDYKINHLIERVLDGIKSYQRLPRTFFGGHLGFFAAIFDNKRGLMRANAYYTFLSNPQHDLGQKCIMLHALFANHEGPELRRQVNLAAGLEAGEGKRLTGHYLKVFRTQRYNMNDIFRLIRIVNNKPVNNVFFGI